MTDPSSMQLVFRLAGIGFALPVDQLVEVCEVPISRMEYEVGETGARTRGRFNHRETLLTVFALAPALGLADRFRPEVGQVVLVLCGRAGFWGVVVDAIEGIFPAREFAPHPLPKLLERETPLPFERLLLWREEPLLGCEALLLEAFLREA
jgi:chemotaxis signal transduction protein